VEKILLKGGRARGVRLADGTEISSEKAVVSNVEPKQVFLNLLKGEDLPEEFLEEVRGFRYSTFTIFGVHLALSEDPLYRSSSPEPNHSFNVMLGVDTLEDIRKQFYDLSLGLPPQPPGYMALHPTRFDPTIAPPEKHVAILWQYVPCALKGGNGRWEALKEGYADACVGLLLRSTRNLDGKKVIGRLIYTPLDIARDNISMVGGDMHSGQITQDQMGIFRPFPGYGSYRTPVQGLYLCGPSTHPRGGCHGANGYNAAGVVAEDLGVEKWWERGRNR
jgi:phytoene dehydrogenase-like protein